MDVITLSMAKSYTNTALQKAKDSGEFKPIKGTDYLTPEDLDFIVNHVKSHTGSGSISLAELKCVPNGGTEVTYNEVLLTMLMTSLQSGGTPQVMTVTDVDNGLLEALSDALMDGMVQVALLTVFSENETIAWFPEMLYMTLDDRFQVAASAFVYMYGDVGYVDAKLNISLFRTEVQLCVRGTPIVT